MSSTVRIDWPDRFRINSSKWFTSATKRNRGSDMFHWLLVASKVLKGVLQGAEPLSNKAMPTFSRIRAHQSTSERININLWKRKTKPASVNYSAVVVLATNKTCGGFPWWVSFLCCRTSSSKNNFSSQCRRVAISFPHSLVYCGSVSHLIYRVFRWYFLTFCYWCCTTGQTRPILIVT